MKTQPAAQTITGVARSRVADLGRLVYAIHDREMPEPQIRGHALLALDTYREHADLSPDEVRTIPLLAWSMMLHYDTSHVLQYLGEMSGPDRGEHWVCKDTRAWGRIRDEWEKRFEELAKVLRRPGVHGLPPTPGADDNGSQAIGLIHFWRSATRRHHRPTMRGTREPPRSLRAR